MTIYINIKRIVLLMLIVSCGTQGFGQIGGDSFDSGNRVIKTNILMWPSLYQQWRIQYETLAKNKHAKSNMLFLGYNYYSLDDNSEGTSIEGYLKSFEVGYRNSFYFDDFVTPKLNFCISPQAKLVYRDKYQRVNTSNWFLTWSDRDFRTLSAVLGGTVTFQYRFNNNFYLGSDWGGGLGIVVLQKSVDNHTAFPIHLNIDALVLMGIVF